MMAFRLNVDQLELFFTICRELNADTEEKRVAILQAMAELKQVDGVTVTTKSKEEYLKHLSDKFGKILVVKNKENDNGTT